HRFRKPRARRRRRQHHAGRGLRSPRRGIFPPLGDRARRAVGGGDDAHEEARALITTRSPRERAYLVGILLPGSTQEKVGDQMSELADLARTAGLEVIGSDVQRRSDVDPAHFIGMGKVAALRDMKLEGEFDLVVCNEDLSPRQQRNLELELKIEQVRTQRHQQRTGRRRAELETAAIVGYTNAGKSTLLNVLTGAGVRAEQRLFATLDPTTRKLELPAGREVLLTDTVGFIQKLPTDLVAAFRATLEEVTEADLIVQVLDLSSASVEDQARTVEAVLADLGAAEKPRVVA